MSRGPLASRHLYLGGCNIVSPVSERRGTRGHSFFVCDGAFDPVGDPGLAVGEEVEEVFVAAGDGEAFGMAEAFVEELAGFHGDPGVGGGVELEDGEVGDEGGGVVGVEL